MPSNPKPEKRLLKVREAAAYTGLSDKRIRGLVHAGELPFIQFEEFGNWWIDRGDLDKLIEKSKKTEC
jgi:excisionase family DNA binding protein